MDNFDTHKWFKKEYLGEGHTDDDEVVAKGDGIEITKKQMERLQKGYPVRLSNGSVLASPFVKEGMSDEEIHAIKRHEELTDDDKLKLAKIQAMMDRERALREEDDDINEMDAPMHIEKLMDAAEMAYDAGMDVDEILGMIEQHLGLKMGDY